MTSPRVIYEVRWDRANGAWRVHVGGRPTVSQFDRKVDAVAAGRVIARKRAGVDRTVTQLRVFNKNGRIAFEATYPRASDPTRSPS